MQTSVPDLETVVAELALLRRRFARAESARNQAEALLEEKSRILAAANDDLNLHKKLLAAELNHRTRQLLDAQRVVGLGTMIWDVEGFRGELSPHCQELLGLSGLPEIDSLQPILNRVVPAERDRVSDWAEILTNRALSAKRSSADADNSMFGNDLADRANPILDCVRSENQLFNEEAMLEFRIVGQNSGQPNRMIRVLAENSFDEALNRVFVFLTVQDVTREVEIANEADGLRQRDLSRLRDLEELTRELQAARETADRANAAKTRFLAMMSHDIRTPMNGVLGMLELFDKAGLSPEQRQTLDYVEASGEQLRMLLDDIIDLERAESGNLKLNRQPLDVQALLRNSIGFWTKAAKDKGLTLEMVRGAFGWPGPPPQWVRADRHRLRQIVDNLLSNAIKYTREGGIIVRIGVIGPARMRFEVCDTGIGIPPDRRRELFEDFGQLYLEGGEAGGSGLGLAICKRIVDLKGGAIGVESGPDRTGSQFWVEIPYQEIEAPTATGIAGKQELRHPEGRRPRILVAEDVETNRIVAKGMLGKLGCDVELVVDGAQAIEAVQQSPFDLVLMDMSMPGVDGPEATRRIRALAGPVSEIPILALTAYSRPEELAPMMEAGAQGSINKPIVLENMYAAIHAVCCGRHGATEN